MPGGTSSQKCCPNSAPRITFFGCLTTFAPRPGKHLYKATGFFLKWPLAVLKVMNEPQFLIETLDVTRHRRLDFRCESEPLTNYLRKQARKEMAARTSVCFVLVTVCDPGRIAGYYTLSAASVALAKLPEELISRLPRYPEVPATLLGRLARDLNFKGRGIGSLLMRDALERVWAHAAEIGSVAIVTEPKDAKAVGFYRQFGFQALDERRMFVAMQEVGCWLKQLRNP